MDYNEALVEVNSKDPRTYIENDTEYIWLVTPKNREYYKEYYTELKKGIIAFEDKDAIRFAKDSEYAVNPIPMLR